MRVGKNLLLVYNNRGGKVYDSRDKRAKES